MNNKKWGQAFDCQPRDVISIIGSGGKTSLLYSLGEELAHSHKVALMTTTKIKLPDPDRGHLILSEEAWYPPKTKGLYIIGNLWKEGKIRGISATCFARIKDSYDYILIEADGARNKAYTLWKPWEPVVLEQTTKTIGVLPIKGLDGPIREDNFYYRQGLKEFSQDKKLTEDLLVEIVHKKMFEKACGKRYLFINQVESAREEDQALHLAQRLDRSSLQVLLGSVKEGWWK